MEIINNLLKTFKQNKIIRLIWLYLRCIRRFGIFLGCKVFSQISKRTTECEISISLPGYDNKIYLRPNTSDIAIFEVVFINRRFDNISERLSPQLIIDAGANIGLVSIFYANRYPNSIIYAVEPEITNYDLLVKNTIEYKNIIPIQAALWKNNSALYINNINAEKWSFRVTERTDSSKNQIRAITVNNILALAKKDYIDIFKIDIEGAEKEVFEEQYETWIYKVGLFIIELHEGIQKGSQKSFYSAISNLKYHEYLKGQNHIISVN